MAVLSSPSSSGSNLLKSGIITTGAMNIRSAWISMTASQHQSQAHSPAASKNQRISAKTGAPMMTVSASDLTMSRTKVFGVVLLKSYFASRTKVL